MAAHSSVNAWKIPRTVEPSELQSMGSHSVGLDRNHQGHSICPSGTCGKSKEQGSEIMCPGSHNKKSKYKGRTSKPKLSPNGKHSVMPGIWRYPNHQPFLFKTTCRSDFQLGCEGPQPAEHLEVSLFNYKLSQRNRGTNGVSSCFRYQLPSSNWVFPSRLNGNDVARCH